MIIVKLKNQEVELVLNNEEISVVIKALKFLTSKESEEDSANNVNLSPADTTARISILSGLSAISSEAKEALDYLTAKYEEEIDKILEE